MSFTVSIKTSLPKTDFSSHTTAKEAYWCGALTQVKYAWTRYELASVSALLIAQKHLTLKPCQHICKMGKECGSLPAISDGFLLSYTPLSFLFGSISH